MKKVDGILLEPVGCLGEFPVEAFDEIASRVFGAERRAKSGSEAYWDFLALFGDRDGALSASQKELAAEMEIRAIDVIELYEDVVPALSELKAMEIQMLIASSLSDAAIQRFLDRFSLHETFAAVWTRDTAGGVKDRPLARAIEGASLRPENVMYLADTAQGLKAATNVGANSILMINDYDEGRRLAMQGPTGGIVSLHELPDFIRLIVENSDLPVRN